MLLARLTYLYFRPQLIPLSRRTVSTTMAAEGVNRAAWQQEKKGPFTAKDTELWEPGEDEVRIKVHT